MIKYKSFFFSFIEGEEIFLLMKIQFFFFFFSANQQVVFLTMGYSSELQAKSYKRNKI